MASSLKIALAALSLFTAAGCGLKGPLYLPDESPDVVEAESVPRNTPAVKGAQKKNRDASDTAAPSGPVDPGQPVKPPGR